MTLLFLLRWSLVLIIFFLGGVGIWAVVVVNRMRWEHAIAMAMLEALGARVGLKRTINVIQQQVQEPEEQP